MFTDTQANLAGSLGIIIAAAGVTLNMLTILALIKYKKTRIHVTTPFIVSLSASDMLFSGLALPLQSMKFLSR